MPLSIPRLQRVTTSWLNRQVTSEAPESSMERLTWNQICRRPECKGRWVALHDCRYDDDTGKATEGALVDVDDDLATLCSRVRDRWKNCAILYVSPVAH